MHTRVSAVVSAHHLLRSHIDMLNTELERYAVVNRIMGRHVAPDRVVERVCRIVALKQPSKHRGASRVRVHKLDQLHYEPERERKEHGCDEATSRRLHVDVETE